MTQRRVLLNCFDAGKQIILTHDLVSTEREGEGRGKRMRGTYQNIKTSKHAT